MVVSQASGFTDLRRLQFFCVFCCTVTSLHRWTPLCFLDTVKSLLMQLCQHIRLSILNEQQTFDNSSA
jgi:hypothetical protein